VGNAPTHIEWSEKWQMPFNTAKCVIVHFGSSDNYYMDNQKLAAVKEVKDLGITITGTSKPGTQCQQKRMPKQAEHWPYSSFNILLLKLYKNNWFVLM